MFGGGKLHGNTCPQEDRGVNSCAACRVISYAEGLHESFETGPSVCPGWSLVHFGGPGDIQYFDSDHELEHLEHLEHKLELGQSNTA